MEGLPVVEALQRFGCVAPNSACPRRSEWGSLCTWGRRGEGSRHATADESGCAVPGDGVRAHVRTRLAAWRSTTRRPRPAARWPRGPVPADRRAHPHAAAVPLEARRGAARRRPSVLGRGPATSTSTSTSASPPCRRPATTARSPRPSRASSPARSTARARCGRCTSSTACPRAGSRVLTKVHHAAVDGVSGRGDPQRAGRPRAPTGATKPPPKPTRRRRARAEPARDARPRAARAAAPAGARAASSCPDAPQPRRRPGRAAGAAASARSARLAARAQRRSLAATPRHVLEPPPVRRRATRFNDAHHAAPALQLRLAAARPRQGDQERARHHASTTSSSTICATAVRECLLERDELPDEPLVSMVPVSVRTPRRVRHVRQQGQRDDRPDPDRRRRPARAADARRTRR